MAFDLCASKTPSDEAVAPVPEWNRQSRGPHLALFGRWRLTCSPRTAHKLLLDSGKEPRAPSQDLSPGDSRRLAVAASPTGSWLGRNLYLSPTDQSDVLAMVAAPCPPKMRQRRYSNVHKHGYRVRPNSGSPCTWCRNTYVSFRAKFDTREKCSCSVCAHELSGYFRLYRRRGSWF